MHEFIILNQLGQGSFGQVFKVKRISDSLEYALKKVSAHHIRLIQSFRPTIIQVRVGDLNNKDLQNALNEVRILASIDHENIIKYKDAFYDQSSQCICIVMEFADSGDLQSKIQQAAKRTTLMSEEEVWNTAHCMLKALKELQQRKILHRDIKCANIFYKGNIAKLGDMNVSKVTESSMAFTQTGTPYYASPEVWREEPYSYKSDIWSLGCVIYEMCTLRPPFRARSLDELFRKVQAGVFQRIPGRYSSSLSNFISDCLTVDVKKRANVDTLLQISSLHVRVPAVKPVILSPKNNREHNQTANMIDTIKLPKDLSDLNKVLPGAAYEQPTTGPQARPLSSKNTNLRKSISKNQILEQFMKQPTLEPIPQAQPFQVRRASIEPKHRVLRHIVSQKLIPIYPEKTPPVAYREPCSTKVLPQSPRNDSFKAALRVLDGPMNKDFLDKLQKIDMRRKERFEREKLYLQLLCQKNRKSTPVLQILPSLNVRPLRIQ